MNFELSVKKFFRRGLIRDNKSEILQGLFDYLLGSIRSIYSHPHDVAILFNPNLSFDVRVFLL